MTGIIRKKNPGEAWESLPDAGNGGSQPQLIGPLSVNFTDFPTVKINTTYDIEVTGSPTGGSFKLKFAGGADSDPIAFDASADDVAAALVAIAEAESLLPSLGGCFPTTSDPLPGPVTIEFLYGVFPVLSVAANNLTGGTAPGVTLTRTTDGQFPSGPVDLYTPQAGSRVLGCWIDLATFVPFDESNSSYGLGQNILFDEVLNYWFYLPMDDTTFGTVLLEAPKVAGVDGGVGTLIPIDTDDPVQFGPDPAGYNTVLGEGHADILILVGVPVAP